MSRYSLRTFLLTLLLLAAGVAALAAVSVVPGATAADAPSFKVTTQRDNDRVEVQPEKGKALFVIHSPSGISGATLERTGERWPEAVVLRLRLKGLENFQASSGHVSLAAAVSSADRTVRVWKDGQEAAPLDPRSTYWLDVRLRTADGKPATALPLADGYFEIELPRPLFDKNPRSITLRWIDFYRN